jgi:hypothetical protein
VTKTDNLYRVIIAGSRTFTDYDLLNKRASSLLLNKHPDIAIVCGMARGADLLGKRFAEEKGYVVHEYHADWDGLGKSAGYRRNEDMAKNADALIAFWDGLSRGTGHMIKLAEKYGLNIRVITHG